MIALINSVNIKHFFLKKDEQNPWPADYTVMHALIGHLLKLNESCTCKN